MALDFSGSGRVVPGRRILIWCDAASERLRVAGLPLWRRALYTACRAGFERIVLVAADELERMSTALARDHRLAGRSWEVVAASDGWAERVASGGGRWVAMSAEWIVEAETLAGLADTDGLPMNVADGPVAADGNEIAAWAAGGWRPGVRPEGIVRSLGPTPRLCLRVDDAADARLAEDALFEGLARNVTNFFARMVDRPMSRAISRLIAPYPITPNQITIFSIAIGILGALVLVHPSYVAGLAGAFLFWAHTVIDGCDGEIARLKFEESEWGAKLDIVGDNVVHAFLFPATAIRAWRMDPEGPFVLLGAISLVGVVVSWLAVYAFVVRSQSPTTLRIFEVFGNREFSYLFLALGLIGRLDWFVWAMVFGLWIFPVALVAARLWDSRSTEAAGG